MIATLVYNATPTKLGSLEVDCTLTETHTADVDVTEHPVESGAAMSDHIRPKQEAFTMSGLFSGTPNPTEGTSRVVDVQAGGDVFKLTTNVSEAEEKKAATRLEEARDALYRIKNGAELITVVTGLKVYENMAMKSLSIERDGRTGISLRFTASFVQVETVELKTTRINEVVSEAKAKKKVIDGPKATSTGPDQTALKKLGGKLGGALRRLKVSRT